MMIDFHLASEDDSIDVESEIKETSLNEIGLVLIELEKFKTALLTLADEIQPEFTITGD